jgi:hypothetical protein
MNNLMTFNIRYFLWFLILLAIEVTIALLVHDRFIRPYFGDVLVVIMIYTFIKTWLKITVRQGLLVVFVFASLVEFSQLWPLIKIFGLENCQMAYWFPGTGFNSLDFIAYSIGLVFVYFIENQSPENKNRNNN